MKTEKRTRKVQTSKPDYMSDVAFADLRKALEDAIAFERGERRDLPVTLIQEAKHNGLDCDVQLVDRQLGS
jgi:hypothetical protein